MYCRASQLLKAIIDYFMKPSYVETTEAPLIKLRYPQHPQHHSSRVVLIFFNKKFSLSAATAFKTVCMEYMIELSDEIRKRISSSKYSSAKNLDRLDPKMVMSPDDSNLCIVPVFVEFPNLAKETDEENVSKELKRLAFCPDLKKCAHSEPVYLWFKALE